MDRPSRNKKAVNYSHYSYFQDEDDEDFACVKPPPKKARVAIKDPDSERSQKTTSASQNHVVVDLTGSGNSKRVSLDDKLYERDLEAALTLSLLDSSRKEEGECATSTDDHVKSEPLQSSPPTLTHCSADVKSIDEGQPHLDSPPVLSNCSVDGNSLGLNVISSMQASLHSVPKQIKASTKATEQQRKPLKGEKDSGEDEDYQPQNTPDSESDADFTEKDESEDETFTVKKKKEKTVKQKTEKKIPQAAKDKKETKEKRPVKASKAKGTASKPLISQSPAAPVSGLKKTATTSSLSKPALCSSPAGDRLSKWNPPGLVGRSPGASQNAVVKSPGQGLRLGLSRLARVKPLHSNTAAH
ncbi:RAD51-associated protein 1-like isoform X2 [Myxocyprinus asiaticus]|uniref:RAD51-associated protein 1-like isoform X2 n=1 Tax=Myxocyprinus asiaticus TaxID=70543 RepID=UPI00222360D1|nr:RAD51-associated protein 1-like isoform X2 [Myxocyprinus asiaticus]